MTSNLTSPPGRSQQIATRIVFLIAGIGMATWAPLVPFAKERAQVDEGMLGLLLLCLGGGSIIAMPLAGALMSKWGCRLVITLSTLIFAVALPFLATLSSLPGLMASLMLFGAGLGALDVSMNVQAIMVERASGRAMMSGFHGLFSLGGMIGAAGVAGLLAGGIAPLSAVAVVMGVVAAALVASYRFLLPYGSAGDGPLFALPRGIVLAIGLVCFVVFLMEGAVLDWSAVFLSAHHGMAAEHAGLGYAAFAAAMTLCRLTGDRIVQRLGGGRVVLLGGICAAIGVVVTLLQLWLIALIGYALIGVGCANIVPVMFTAAGRQRVMPENVAVPAITTLGYAGILVGPAAIGFVAHLSSLAMAFLMMIGLLVAVALSGRFTRV